MNFPGLDPAWSSFHHAARAIGLARPWSILQCREALGRNEKVLVVATTALGDSLLTTPLIETLATQLGHDRVSLLVRAPYAELYRGDPRLHRVFTVRGKYRWENLGPELRADPHRIALLANLTEPDLLPALWWGGVRGFLRYRGRSVRYPRWIANYDMLSRPGDADYARGHAIENNLAMAEVLGLEATTHRLDLPHLKSQGTKRSRTVLIHPGASRENKRWPAENWARLADEVAEKFPCDVKFTGSEAEKKLVDDIIRKMRAPVGNLAGTLSVTALAEVQAEATAFLSGDTGPYHLAVAMDCPTVTLFAPTDRGSSTEACGPHQVDPARHRAIQTANFGDSIATLSFERVWAEVSALLEKVGGPGQP
jgi:ADP-heptose:LPS heptosyltransferase